MRAAGLERTLVTVALFGVTAAFAYLTLDLGSMARRVPIVVVVPTLILLGVQLLLDLTPRGVARGDVSHPASELATLAWLIFLPVLIAGFGALFALPGYTLLYLKVRARESWSVSLGATVVLGFLAYVVFRFLLTVPLYRGQLWIWMSR